jgi:hypothetical protein
MIPQGPPAAGCGGSTAREVAAWSVAPRGFNGRFITVPFHCSGALREPDSVLVPQLSSGILRDPGEGFCVEWVR